MSAWSSPRWTIAQGSVVAAATLVLGAGDFTLAIGGFKLGGIGTATFGAILLNLVLSSGEETPAVAR